MDSRAAVGTRCVCDGFFATIRFIGEVPPTSGVWFGVEWDNPSRGKHSGEHEGAVYFTTRTPGSGSFIRPRKASFGLSFMEAMENKYGVVEEEVDIVVGGQAVELVGMDKVAKRQREYSNLADISLRGEGLGWAGPPGEIAAKAPNIRELSIGDCPLVSDWRGVAMILSQLHQLEALDLSGNEQLAAADDITEVGGVIGSLSTLSINRTALSWLQICTILSAAKGLRAVHLCENHLTTLKSPAMVTMPPGLQLLNLEKNQLSDWRELLELSPQLERLETLILNHNQLIDVTIPSSEGPHPFPVLISLSITHNQISQWSSIDSWNSLPSLKELKLTHNPLLQDESSFDARQLLISRLPTVKALNRSNVSSRERQLAERYYVKRYGPLWMKAKDAESAKQTFISDHPRFEHLIEIHGIPEEVLTEQKPVSTALKHGLISVTVRCPEAPAAKQITKKLPAAMTVQKLKGLLQRLYKVDYNDQKLSYLDSRGDCEIPLDDDLRELGYFSIQNGDTILLRW